MIAPTKICELKACIDAQNVAPHVYKFFKVKQVPHEYLLIYRRAMANLEPPLKQNAPFLLLLSHSCAFLSLIFFLKDAATFQRVLISQNQHDQPSQIVRELNSCSGE